MGSPNGSRELVYMSETESFATDMDFQGSKEEAHHQDSAMELVVGRDSPLRERSQKDREHLKNVRRRLFELNEKFASLVTDVRKAIESESLDDIKTYVINLSMIFKEDHASEQFQGINSTMLPTSDTLGSFSNVAAMSGTQMSAIDSAADVTSTFTAVSKYRLWDPLNFYLLESVVKKFCGKKANLLKSMEEYAKASDEFKVRTLLCDYLDIWPGRSALHEFRDTSVIIMKIKRKYTTCTLQDIAEREIYLENMFHFRRFLLNFSNANRGCVQIVWQVSDCLIQYMKKKIASISGKVWVNETTVKIPGLESHNMEVSFKKHDFQQEHNHPRVYGLDMLDSVESLLQSHDFDTLYKMSIDDPETFWGILSLEFLQWMEPFQKVMDCNVEEGIIKWFTKGKLNISVNCVDRHAKLHSERDALIWVKGTSGQVEKVTYGQLLKMVCQIANILKQKGVTKGDTVAIYMPVCPLAVASMLACTRIGAVHNVLFSRFNTVLCEGKKQMMPLKARIANAKAIITANEAPLGTDQVLTLKKDIDCVLEMKTDVKFVLVAKRTDAKVDMTSGRDYFLEEAMEEQSADCTPEPMDSEDDLFIIYTSGSSGVPKGVVHTHAGYLLHVAVTHKYYFDYKPGDVYACVADIGWITGHSYVVYGPLCNGATTVLFESSTAGSHVFSVIEQLKINQFYTTPSNIRALMSEGEKVVDKFPLKSLRVIGSVGEPLSGDAWKWFYGKVGKKRCHPVDTWWQTELGGIAMAPPCLSNVKSKPGPMKPSFGVLPVILNDKGKEDSSGNLLLIKAIPGMGRKLIGGKSFKQEYFQHEGYNGLYYTSDVAHKDDEGDFVVIGRVEDVIKFGDRFLNLPLIEESLSKCHKDIVEAFLVMPKSNHGEQGLTACIAVDKIYTEVKLREIADTVQKNICGMTGSCARTVIVKSEIEKTFSGKVVKYVLREIDEKCHHQLGTGDIKAYYYSEQFSRMAFEDYNVQDYVF